VSAELRAKVIYFTRDTLAVKVFRFLYFYSSLSTADNDISAFAINENYDAVESEISYGDAISSIYDKKEKSRSFHVLCMK
jgi:hypothetical protein